MHSNSFAHSLGNRNSSCEGDLVWGEEVLEKKNVSEADEDGEGKYHRVNDAGGDNVLLFLMS